MAAIYEEEDIRVHLPQYSLPDRRLHTNTAAD